jgi:oxalate decarboxylase/phosphoglucose isomerase-like protein (cupin superfamily)
MNITRLPRTKHMREDGWLAELISMKYNDHPFFGIHSYVVSIAPGKSRANHYHRKKEEWIAPAAGAFTLLVEDSRTGERQSLLVDTRSDEYTLLFIPAFIAHSLRNEGNSDAAVIVFSRTPEDPEDTIPFGFA